VTSVVSEPHPSKAPARSLSTWAAGALACSALLLLPLAVKSTYQQHLFVVVFLFLVLSASYNLVVGYTGYLSLAHATFFGLGGYASAIATTRYHLHVLGGVGASIVLTSAVALVLGWIVFRRVRGFAFSIMTLGFAITVFILVSNWITFTGGPTGILGIPRPSLTLMGRTMVLVRTVDFYYAGLALVALTIAVVRWIRTSRVGRALLAIRENEHLASALGIDAFAYKMFAFALGAVLAGLAGSFYAHYITVVTPEILWIFWITSLLAILIVGGPGSLIGGAMATVLLVLVPELLRVFEVYRELLYGTLLLLVIRFLPQGIGGLIDRALYRRRLSQWRSSPSTAS